MGQHKNNLIEAQEGQRWATYQGERRCPYCFNIVPYGTDLGQYGECLACVGALKDD